MIFFFLTIAGLALLPGLCDWWRGFSSSGLAVICWPSRGTDVLSGGRTTGQGLEIINPFMKVRQGWEGDGKRCSVLFHCHSAGYSQGGDHYKESAALFCSRLKVKLFWQLIGIKKKMWVKHTVAFLIDWKLLRYSWKYIEKLDKYPKTTFPIRFSV